MAIEVTEEMRQAVYQQDCELNGHILDIANAWSNDPNVHPDRFTPDVRAEDDEQIPHLSCKRCGKVWLVIEDPGTSYQEAVSKLRGRMKDPDTVKPRRRPTASSDTRH